MTKRSLRRMKYRVVVYNELGQKPRDPTKQKILFIEGKRIAKRDTFFEQLLKRYKYV